RIKAHKILPCPGLVPILHPPRRRLGINPQHRLAELLLLGQLHLTSPMCARPGFARHAQGEGALALDVSAGIDLAERPRTARDLFGGLTIDRREKLDVDVIADVTGRLHARWLA